MHRRLLLRALAVGIAAAACGRARPTTSAGPTHLTPSPSRPSPISTSPPAPEPVSEEPVSATPVVVAVLCRDAWQARPPAGEYRHHTIGRLTVHHSATVLGDNAHAPSRFRQHQRFHQDSGWPDIAYHHGVDRRGNVYDLRPASSAGDTFTDYDPTGHYLLLAEGNFDQESPTDEQLEAMARMLAWASGAFSAPLDTISGHRDHAATSCPGDHLYPRLPDLQARAVELGRVDIASHCGASGRDRVAAIERGEA
ncbi:MAG: peptidoglycan recognition protein family protein [Actinobacteria bacterium]|nr:peptidoglycan recognition protein family protein [Actinomycetota bacterium]